MTPRASLSVLRWLIRDTFRQARGAGVFWLMLAVSLMCVALCLTATVVAEGPDNPGRLDMAFGAVQVPLDRGRADAVRTLEVYLAGGVGDVVGLLLALMWTASFLPTFLEASTASVLLVKPVSRGGLLLGKCLGVLAFVAVQDGLFVGGTWLALGLRTSIWDTNYLLCLPLLLLHFAVFFSFSAMLAAATAQHGRLRVRLDAVLAVVLGDEPRPARLAALAGPTKSRRRDWAIPSRSATGSCPSRSIVTSSCAAPCKTTRCCHPCSTRAPGGARRLAAGRLGAGFVCLCPGAAGAGRLRVRHGGVLRRHGKTVGILCGHFFRRIIVRGRDASRMHA